MKIWKKIKNWISDRYHILFKSAAANHLRIQEVLKNSDGSYQLTVKFDSYSELKNYQRKLRRMTVSLSSAVAMVVVAFVVAPYIMNPNRSSAASYIWKQTSWDGVSNPAANINKPGPGTSYQFADTNVQINSVAPADSSVSLKLVSEGKVQSDNGTAATGFNLTGSSNSQTEVTPSGTTGDDASVGLQSISMEDYGSGADGSVTISSAKNINTDIIAAGRTCADGVSYNVISLTSNTAQLSGTPPNGCFAPGDKVMLLNEQGDGTSTANVGNYEFLSVQSISGDTITFTTNKVKSYGSGATDDENIGTLSAATGDAWSTFSTYVANASVAGPNPNEFYYFGNGTTSFRKFIISPLTPSNILAASPAAIGYTAGTVGIYPKSGDFIYYFQGGSAAFWAYSISNNSWNTVFDPADAPGAVGASASLVYPGSGDYIYAFRGGNTADFWRYSISLNAWEARTAAPATVSSGGSLVYPGSGDYIYAIRGASTATFWRYSISANTWSTLASTPATNGAGSALVYPKSGDYIYAVNSANLWAYSISGNTWNTPFDPANNSLATLSTGGNIFYPGEGDYIYAGKGNTYSVIYRYELKRWPHQRVVLQRVPQYNDVTIASGGSLTADNWNGLKGGVLAYYAKGTVNVESGGNINVDGKGYLGAGSVESCSAQQSQGESYNGAGSASPSPNLGGGGGAYDYSAVCDDIEGGGGGYGTSGGDVDEFISGGGTYGTANLSKIFLGSGGGGGYNGGIIGNSAGGGGIIYLAAKNVNLSSNLSSSGKDTFGYTVGSGSGGSIFLKGDSVNIGDGLLLAKGGFYPGQTNAEGGDGRIFIQSSNVSGTSVPAATTGTAATTYYTSGTFTSGAIDTGQLNDSWGNLSWNQTLNAGSLGILISTSADGSTWTNFKGTDGSDQTDCAGGKCYTTNTGQQINAVHNGARYIKYKLFLAGPAGDNTKTPLLNDITLNYKYYPTVAQKFISSPFNSTSPNAALSNIAWNKSGTGQIKFQIRTAKDNGGSPDWASGSGWCGPNACAANLGEANDYYLADLGNAINTAQADNVNDQWFQYAAFLNSDTGLQSPVLNDVTLSYSYNTPPIISTPGVSQVLTDIDLGKVKVDYQINETKGDDGILEDEQAYTGLFYQPNGVRLGAAAGALGNADTNSITGEVALENPNNQPIPSQGDALIGSELIHFTSTGNSLTITERHKSFSTGYPTLGSLHFQNEDIFFMATNVSGAANMVLTGLTEIPASKSIIWDAKNEPFVSLEGSVISDLALKVVANDGDSFTPVGSSLSPLTTLDYEGPSILSATSTSNDGSYKEGANIALELNFSENVKAAGSIVLNLNSGQTCTIPSMTIASNKATCTYTGSGDTQGQKLRVDSIVADLLDQFGNVMPNKNIATNLDVSKNIVIDNAVPEANDLENRTVNSQTSNSILDARDLNGSGIASYAWTADSPNVTFGSPTAASTTISANADGTYAVKVTITDNAGNTTEKIFTLIWDTTNPDAAGKPNVPSLTNDNTPQISWTNATDSLSKPAKYEVQRKLEGEQNFVTVDTIIFTDEAKFTDPTFTYQVPQELPDGKYYYQIVTEDNAGNRSTSQSSEIMMIDTTPPVLTSFTTTNSNGLYGVGEMINITANYSDAVSGKIKAGSKMRVIMDIAEENAYADLVASADGTTLSGSFEIKATPLRKYDTADLNVRSIVNNPTFTSIEDLAGNAQTNFDLPASNLADNANIQVDTGGPILTGLSATSGSFNAGKPITITAKYSEALRIGSKAKIKINVDSDGEFVNLLTINGSELSGTYNVKELDNTQALQVFSFETVDGFASPEESVKDQMGDVGNPSTIPSPLPNEGNIAGTQIDTTTPVTSIIDDVNPDPNQGDTVTLGITETNLSSIKYIFALNNDCATKSYDSAQDYPLEKTKVFNTEDNNGKYICFKVLDKSGNFAFTGSANPFNVDVLNPTATLKADMTKASGQVNLEASDSNRDNTGMEMMIKAIENNAEAACDFSSANWVPYSQYSDISTTASFVKVCATLKDAAGNILNEVSTVTPNTPENFTLNDLTNQTFAGFTITWNKPTQEGTSGFNKYNLNWCKSLDSNECAPDQIQEISDKNQNYTIFKDLDKSKKYCFKSSTQDLNGDVSRFSNLICAVPGQGPVLVNTDVDFKEIPFVGDITRNSVKVIFETVNKNDNNAPLATNAKVEVFATDDLNTQPFKTVEDPFNVIHSVNITGLESSKKYYLRVTVTDPTGNEQIISYGPAKTAAIDPSLFFTTAGILNSIDAITESVITDSKAVVNFTTNENARCFAEFKLATATLYDDLADANKNWDTLSKNHSQTLSGLLAKTAYDYKITCDDNKGNVITSEEHNFTTAEKGLSQGEFEASQDKSAPEISNISLNTVTGENATVTWNTNEESNSMLAYEIEGSDFMLMSGDYLINSDKSKFSTSHSVQLKGLLPASKYLFTVMSTDASGNIAQSSQSTFTTKEPSSLSSIKVQSKALGQATITWETGSAISSLVEYGLTTAYGSKKEDSSKVKEHSITLSDLTPGETYHFRVRGEDDQKNIFASSDITFQPKAPPKISDFKVDSITEHGAIVTFTTNVPTDSLVIYEDTKEKNNSGFQGKPEVATKHETKLSNLTSGTEFSLKLKVRDEDGNETEETFPNFTTTKDEVPPKIERVKTDSALTQNDKVQAIISWNTDELSTGEIIYKEGRNGNEKKFEVNSAPSFSHIGVITSFKSGIVYYFKVVSEDQAGNKVTSTDYALLTPKQRQNIIQIIIGNFTDIFGWAKF